MNRWVLLLSLLLGLVGCGGGTAEVGKVPVDELQPVEPFPGLEAGATPGKSLDPFRAKLDPKVRNKVRDALRRVDRNLRQPPRLKRTGRPLPRDYRPPDEDDEDEEDEDEDEDPNPR